MDTESFGKVFERSTQLLPQLISRNSSSIWGWLDAGADADKDIIPTIERLASKNPNIGGYSYFTNSVMQAKAERESAMRAITHEEKVVKQSSDYEKARMIAFTTRKLGRSMVSEERWLNDYEAKHGVVVL